MRRHGCCESGIRTHEPLTTRNLSQPYEQHSYSQLLIKQELLVTMIRLSCIFHQNFVGFYYHYHYQPKLWLRSFLDNNKKTSKADNIRARNKVQDTMAELICLIEIRLTTHAASFKPNNVTYDLTELERHLLRSCKTARTNVSVVRPHTTTTLSFCQMYQSILMLENAYSEHITFTNAIYKFS